MEQHIISVIGDVLNGKNLIFLTSFFTLFWISKHYFQIGKGSIISLSQEKNLSNLLSYPVVFLLAALCIGLITYIGVSSGENLINYVSFAATLSSLILSVLAIIQSLIQGNKGNESYGKIEVIHKQIESQVKSLQEYSYHQKTIYEELEFIKKRVEDTIEGISQVDQKITTEQKNSYAPRNSDGKQQNQLHFVSIYGIICLYAAVLSTEKKKSWTLGKTEDSDPVTPNKFYAWGFLMGMQNTFQYNIQTEEEEGGDIAFTFSGFKSEDRKKIKKLVNESNEEVVKKAKNVLDKYFDIDNNNKE